MEVRSHETFALEFRFKDKRYTLELHPLTLKMDGQPIVRINDGSGRRLQESQLKVLRHLLEHNGQYCSLDEIAASAALGARDPSNAIRAHVHWLRTVLDDSSHPHQLIRTGEARRHKGSDTTYGLFEEVERIEYPVVASAGEVKDTKRSGQEEINGSQVEIANIRPTLRHLYGPVLVVAALSALVVLSVWLVMGKPNHPVDRILATPIAPASESKQHLEALLDYQVRDYKANLSRFGWDCFLQAFLVGVTLLLILRRSDSLKVFDYSIRLSWLHLFVLVLLLYLWLDFGFVLHGLIWGRLRGVELIKALNYQTMEYQKTVFHDARFIDGWFLAFIDGHRGENYSGINHSFSASTAAFFALVLGTLMSLAHASALAIPPIAIRRYLYGKSDRWFSWYYLSALAPLTILLSSHVQFAYGGENRNWIQLYIEVVTILLMAVLVRLSVVADRGSYYESVGCLRRRHQATFKGAAPDELDGRRISLIGDSLSTSFHLSSLPSMVFQNWVAWKRNWFLRLEVANGDGGVLERVSAAYGTVQGFHHASVSAKVDDGNARDVIDRLRDTWHFSHQVDEVLSGPFPDLLLIWIGHNDVDWKLKTRLDSGASLDELSDQFISRYAVQLRRLIRGALGSRKRCMIVAFGLISFESFFDAREGAERERHNDGSLYPQLESCYKYFVSMMPEHRQRMIELGNLYNRKLAVLCSGLAEPLSNSDARLTYSDAMAKTEMGKPDLLSTVDAWHPSTAGHKALADAAYQIVRDHAEFLGW